MRGGFYNLKNLKKCGWGDEAKGASNNYCKDIEGDVILNIYKPRLNELLEQINRQIIEYNLKLESLKKIHPNILDIYTIDKYENNIIKIELSLKKDLSDVIKEDLTKQILDIESKIEEIKKRIKSPYNLELLTPENKKNAELLLSNKSNIDKKSEIAIQINKLLRKDCVEKIEIESLLNSIPDYSYKKYTKELNEYFEKTNDAYDNDIKCIVPFKNNPNNIFELIKDNNFKIYRMFNKVYYELYEHTTLATAAAAEVATEAAIYTNYLLDDFYILDKIQDIPQKIEKQLLYPNYSSLHPREQKLNKLSLIIYNSDNILNNLIFGLKINTVGDIDIFLNRYMINNTSNLILPYDTYTLLDMFIISNEFHNYYYLQSNTPYYFTPYNMNTDIYTQEYYDNKTDNKFIKFINEQINENKYIDLGNIRLSEEFKIQINNLKLIDKYWNDKIINKNLLINTYNYLSLLNIKINTELSNFEKINTLLKYTPNQIKMLILIDLYKEIVENYFLYMCHSCSEVIKILLNVIYYKSIYKWDKVKNLINYSMQFNYLKTKSNYYDIDAKYENYEQKYLPIKPISDPRRTYNIFYTNLFADKPIKYVLYNYSNYKMFIKKYDKYKDVSEYKDVPESYASSCGEILIFNIINLFIYDDRKNDINPDFLPVNTHILIRNFYVGKTLKLFDSNPKIIINDFIPLLHNIPFFITSDIDIKNNVYKYYYTQNGRMINGTEILPSYINVCRVLGYLFDHNIDNSEKIICKHDILKTILLSFRSNIKDILLQQFNPSTILDENTFIINTDVIIQLNYIDILFRVNHGDMNIIGTVKPDDYIAFSDRELYKIYENIIKYENTTIFRYLHHTDSKLNTNIVKKMKIIFSNNYYKILFEADIFTYIYGIISLGSISIKDLIELLNFLGHTDVGDFINTIIQETIDITPKIILIIRIFRIYYEHINFNKIDIEKMKTILLLSDNKLIYELIYDSLVSVQVLTFILKMGQDLNDIILDRILIQLTSYDLIRYLKLYKPKKLDVGIFCDIIKKFNYKENCITEYLLTGISIENQKILYNKLYFTEKTEFGEITNLITHFINTANKLENIDYIKILNESFTLFLALLNLQIIDDNIIVENIYKYFSMTVMKLNTSKIENERNYCLLKSFIFFNNKLLDKTPFKSDFEAFVKQAPDAFTSDIGKELLESFGLNGNLAAAHQAKYLKYKSKYLQLKQFI